MAMLMAEALKLNADRAKTIKNLKTGNVFHKEGNADNWVLLYKDALERPGDYEIAYDTPPTVAPQEKHKYESGDLRKMGTEDVRQIARRLGVPTNDVSKNDMIKNIMLVQSVNQD